MPLFELQTNVVIDVERRQRLLSRLSTQTAEILGKPESYVMVSLHAEVPMLFGGSSDPTALFSVYSLGEISGAQASRFSAEVSAVLSEELGVKAERVYSKYVGWAERELWGYNGGTFG